MSHSQTLQGTGGQIKATEEPKRRNKEAKAQMERRSRASAQECAATSAEAGPAAGHVNALDREDSIGHWSQACPEQTKNTWGSQHARFLGKFSSMEKTGRYLSTRRRTEVWRQDWILWRPKGKQQLFPASVFRVVQTLEKAGKMGVGGVTVQGLKCQKDPRERT